jgi:HPt (histidine-containing phosphotransfer) domain-containing protein
VDYKLINTSYIESVTGGDKEILTELIVLFRDQVAEISAEMLQLNEKKDFHSLGMLAHKAKSSVAIMGMSELASLLKTFELEAKENNNADRYAEYISRFETDTLSAITELDSYLKEL